MGKLLNFVAFQIGWFACVLGAGYERAWIGPLVVAALLVAHLAQHAARPAEVRLLLAVGAFGFAVDSIQAALGVFAVRQPLSPAWVCPPWLLALWIIFGSTLNSSMSWLARRYVLAAALGAVLGPLAYKAGAKLGALSLHAHAAVSLGSLALVWGLAMPLLLWMANRLRPTVATPAA